MSEELTTEQLMKVAIALDKLSKLQALVDEQAEDWELWLTPNCDDKLREALRELHTLIEE